MEFIAKVEGALLPIVNTVNDYMSDYILFFLLVGIGLFYTIRTRFVQVRCFGEGMKKVFGGISLKGGKQKGGLSSFQALATAIAAQVGTGNIVGACGAILIGGPGAIFWMWIIAFFGMATIYSEAVMAQQTKEVQADGSVLGGPVYYIKKVYKGKFGKFLAGFFAVAVILALGCMGAMVQSNSIASSISTSVSSVSSSVDGWVVGLIVGIVLATICAVIFIGGVQRIASVAEKVVPIMALVYLVIGVVILCINIKVVPATLGMIFKYAFVPNALLGGAIGAGIKAAISQGVKRGLFSNEAGMGSTPHAHAQAKVKTPHEQGVVAMIGVFIDTFVVLTITALVVISTLYASEIKPLKADYNNVTVKDSNIISVTDDKSVTNDVYDILKANGYELDTNANGVIEESELNSLKETDADKYNALINDGFENAFIESELLRLEGKKYVIPRNESGEVDIEAFKALGADGYNLGDQNGNLVNSVLTSLKSAGLYSGNVYGKTDMMQTSVGAAFKNSTVGNILIALCLTFFAFTTIIGWNFFGRQNVEYLFGKRKKVATIIYSVIAIAFVFIGCVVKSNDLVWGLTDMFNNLMVIPNVMALAFLSKFVVDEAKAAYARKKALKAEKVKTK